MPWRLWGRMNGGIHRYDTTKRTTPLSWRRMGNERTSQLNKGESGQQIYQVDKMWRAKEPPPRQSLKYPQWPWYHTNHDPTVKYGTFLPALTQGENDSISELRNGKTGKIRSNYTAGTVFTTTHCHTCGKLWQKYIFQVRKTRHQIWILESGS